MGSQSTAKTIFLLASMIGWLIVGAALMYLFPFIADRLIASETDAPMDGNAESGSLRSNAGLADWRHCARSDRVGQPHLVSAVRG